MRIYECAASYRHFVEGNLRLSLLEAGTDQKRREQSPPLTAKPRVPDQFIDATQTGTFAILLVDIDDDEHTLLKAIRALKAAPTTRPSSTRPVPRRTNARRGART